MNGEVINLTGHDAALEDYLASLLAPAGKAPTAPVAWLDCWLIEAAGIALALPQDAVLEVCPWPLDVERADAAAGAVAGRWPRATGSVLLIDTARVIVPQARRDRIGLPLAGRAHEIALVDGGRCGLVSETPCRMQSIAEADICRRGEATSRPWLSGMIARPRCALLDVGEVVNTARGESPSGSEP
jgi:hypothetical protein